MAEKSSFNQRARAIFATIVVGFALVLVRLFYWQIIQAESSQTVVELQSTQKVNIRGRRGRIYADQGELLVGNQSAFDVYLNKRELEVEVEELISILVDTYQEYQGSIAKSDTDQFAASYFFESVEEFDQQLQKVVSRNSNWIKILPEIPLEFKEKVTQLKIVGLHSFETEARFYPEASMAAHLTGFVGKTDEGNNIGYFGIEGALEKELQSKSKEIIYRTDAKGISFSDQQLDYSNLDGRDITTTIKREIQFIAEAALSKGVARSQSTSGEIVIIEPKTGAILAVATWPHYSQINFRQFNTQDFKNPTLANLYEPGSTFKVLTLATGIDLGLISPETECTKCAGPRVIAGHTINTWNKEFNPNITMKEALRKSDNTAMVFVSEQIGAERFMNYIRQFGIGEPLNIDLQEDVKTPLPSRVGPVELATISFGQGISTNSMQMVRAISAIANNGVIMKPYIVSSVYDPQTHEIINYKPQELRRVISADTAKIMTQMMIHSASRYASWVNQSYQVAGKSGTSQIPSESGGYRDWGTIASYVGFAPADEPKFVMLVKLTEPRIDPWGETTAVPIWYDVAEKILLRL